MSAAPTIPTTPGDIITFDLSKVTDLTYSYGELRTEIYAVMFVLCVVGYVVRVWQNRQNPETHFTIIPHIALLVIFGAAFPHMKPLFQTLFYLPAEKLEAANNLFQVNEAMNHFKSYLAATPPDKGPDQDIFSYLGSFSWNFFEMGRNALTSAIFSLFYLLLATIAGIIVTPFYFLQLTMVETCFAFSPIAFGCMAVPALKEKGSGFLTMLASVMAWPLGFAIVAAMTNISLSAFPAAAGSQGFAFGPLIGAMVSATVMILGTTMVPPTAFYLFMHGGVVFNPIANAMSAVPIVGRMVHRGK